MFILFNKNMKNLKIRFGILNSKNIFRIVTHRKKNKQKSMSTLVNFEESFIEYFKN